MGRRGPRPTPTAILNLRGSWRGKRRGPEVTAPAPKNRQAPEWLRADPVACAEWRRVVPSLAAMGMLCDLDWSMIAAYCKSWSQYRHALNEHEKIGCPMVYKTPEGVIKPNPMLVEVNRSFARYRAAACECGLSTASRVSLAAGGANTDPRGGEPDAFEAFLDRRNDPNLRLAR